MEAVVLSSTLNYLKCFNNRWSICCFSDTLCHKLLPCKTSYQPNVAYCRYFRLIAICSFGCCSCVYDVGRVAVTDFFYIYSVSQEATDSVPKQNEQVLTACACSVSSDGKRRNCNDHTDKSNCQRG